MVLTGKYIFLMHLIFSIPVSPKVSFSLVHSSVDYCRKPSWTVYCHIA